MFGRASTLLILLIWTQAMQGQGRVIGASEPVRACVGDAVVLPCRCDPPVDLTPLTVEWSRTELQPHPSDRLKGVSFVHVYTNHSDDDPDMKIPEFVNRTQLFLDQLAAGVASLRILNVALSDNGTYKCYIPNLQTNGSLQWTQVTLVVDEAAAPTRASDLNSTQKDSGPDGTSKTYTVRYFQPMTTIFSVSLIILYMGLICVCLTQKSQLKSAGRLHSESGGSAVVLEDDKSAASSKDVLLEQI